MKKTFRLLFLLPLFVLLGSVARGSVAATLPLAELAKPGRVLMLRHAEAPGVGDPPGFRLDDCGTQRNLDDSGRRQARALGARLANAGVAAARVYSSQWCRCLETARLAFPKVTVEPYPALNSFFEDRSTESQQTREAAARIAANVHSGRRSRRNRMYGPRSPAAR